MKTFPGFRCVRFGGVTKEMRGWAADGIPTRATVERFGLQAYDVDRPHLPAGAP